MNEYSLIMQIAIMFAVAFVSTMINPYLKASFLKLIRFPQKSIKANERKIKRKIITVSKNEFYLLEEKINAIGFSIAMGLIFIGFGVFIIVMTLNENMSEQMHGLWSHMTQGENLDRMKLGFLIILFLSTSAIIGSHKTYSYAKAHFEKKQKRLRRRT